MNNPDKTKSPEAKRLIARKRKLNARLAAERAKTNKRVDKVRQQADDKCAKLVAEMTERFKPINAELLGINADLIRLGIPPFTV